MEFDARQIMEVIPHRYPFLLIDKIVEFEEGKRAVGIKNVTMNEPFFSGAFSGKTYNARGFDRRGSRSDGRFRNTSKARV